MWAHAALALLLSIASWGATSNASAQSIYNTFEDNQYADWGIQGSAGIDINRGYSHAGYNNGWIRAAHGWNALYLRRSIYLTPQHRYCSSMGYIRGSWNVQNFYYSIIDANTGEVLTETGPLSGDALTDSIIFSGYARIGSGGIDVRPEHHYRAITVRIGFWGNGQDAWVQIDNVSLDC